MFGTDNEENRGQVGIGTLIVFIALVLVAAIAAGVLINTAGFLQSQAEATGEESTSQVSDGLTVVSSTAQADNNGEIDNLTVEVSLSPGSDSINVTEGTLSWVGESGSTTEQITYSSGGVDAVSSNVYVASAEDPELTSSEETVDITIAEASTDSTVSSPDGSIGSNDLPMQENDEATVTITTRSGGETVETLNVPNIVQANEGVDL